MLKKFFRYLKYKFPELFDDKKYQQDTVYKEGHDLSNYLIGMYSIEEQSTIVEGMRQNLIYHREEEIKTTQNYLERLKADKEKLHLTQQEP